MNRTGNLASHRVYIRQIRITGLALWGANSNEDDLRLLRGVAKVRSELNLAAGAMFSQQFRKKLLVNRHQALI